MRFSDMLDRKAEEIKQPPLPPAGLYLFQVKKHPETTELKGKDGTIYDKLTFEAAVVGPHEVDEDALEEFGKIAGYTLRKDFLFNTNEDEEMGRERTLNSVKMFLTTLGCFEDGMTMSEGLAGSPNRQFVGELKHRPNPNDPEQFFAEIGRTFEA